ncbi:MAG: ATP/GTP-binding protein [Flavitalea sp.]
MKNIVKCYAAIAALLLSGSSLFAQHQLIKKWETDTLLKVPESVLYDKVNQVLYASNIDGQPDGKDGQGSIAKIGLDGKIINAEWVKGLSAPKGLGQYKNTLWVADIDEVVAIDIKSGTITQKIPVEGALFLNDITVDKKGVVYVSDSKGKKVFKLENGKVSLVVGNLQGPNGLLAHDNKLYVLDNGGLYRIDAGNKLVKLADGMEGGTDGVENVAKNEFIVSCWAGSIYYINADGSKEKLLDTRDQKINSADIGYDADKRIVYVPTFWKNNVVAYELK